jgi:hypothetical protein
VNPEQAAANSDPTELIPTQDNIRKGSETQVTKKSSKAGTALLAEGGDPSSGTTVQENQLSTQN